MAGIIVTFLGFMVFMAFYFIDESKVELVCALINLALCVAFGLYFADIAENVKVLSFADEHYIVCENPSTIIFNDKEYVVCSKENKNVD